MVKELITAVVKVGYFKNRRLINDISKLGLLIVIIFVTLSLIFLISKILSDLTALTDFSSAFAGALFGYLAVRLTDIIKDLKQRQLLNLKALVSLEHLNMQAIDKIGTVEFVAKDWLKSFERAKREKVTILNFNQFREIPINREPLLDLLNLDLVNDFAKYFSIVERVNDSMYSLEKFYDTILTAASNGNIDSYTLNLDTLIGKTAEVLLFVDDVAKAAEDIQAKTRVVSKDISNSVFLNSVKFNKSEHHYTESQLKLIKAEREKIHKELEDSKAKDKSRIQEIIKAGDA